MDKTVERSATVRSTDPFYIATGVMKDRMLDVLTVSVRPDKSLSKNKQAGKHWSDAGPQRSVARTDGKEILASLIKKIGYDYIDYYNCDQSDCFDQHLMGKAKVHISHYWVGGSKSKQKDWEGIAVSTSAYMDGFIKDEYLLHDDNPDFLVEYTMSSDKVDSSEDEQTIIKITAVL